MKYFNRLLIRLTLIWTQILVAIITLIGLLIILSFLMTILEKEKKIISKSSVQDNRTILSDNNISKLQTKK